MASKIAPKDSGALMAIQLSEHLIVIPECKYYSMTDGGVGLKKEGDTCMILMCSSKSLVQS